MQVIALSSKQALQGLLAEHGLAGDKMSAELLASVMRGQLARMYPCPPHALLTATRRALDGLDLTTDALNIAAGDVLEDLQTCGDVVELARVTVAHGEDRSQWLFPAPPGFVVRGNRAYLFGIAPDNAPFLPGEHRNRLQLNGAARFLVLDAPGALTPSSLRALGLRQLDEQEWLGADRMETAAQHLDVLRERLLRHGTDGHMPDMRVLAHQTNARTPYQRRWSADSKATGLHVVRVEQPHGAALWYLAELSDGRCRRSLPLPFHLEDGRGCDQAWRAQMAIDACQGNHASYSVERREAEVALRMDFPLPLFARRRLLFLGGSMAREDNPNVFVVPANEEASERRYLEERLWLRELAA